MSDVPSPLSRLSPWGRTLLYAAAVGWGLDFMMDASRRQRGLMSPFVLALPRSPLANDMLDTGRAR